LHYTMQEIHRFLQVAGADQVSCPESGYGLVGPDGSEKKSGKGT